MMFRLILLTCFAIFTANFLGVFGDKLCYRCDSTDKPNNCLDPQRVEVPTISCKIDANCYEIEYNIEVKRNKFLSRGCDSTNLTCDGFLYNAKTWHPDLVNFECNLCSDPICNGKLVIN